MAFPTSSHLLCAKATASNVSSTTKTMTSPLADNSVPVRPPGKRGSSDPIFRHFASFAQLSVHRTCSLRQEHERVLADDLACGSADTYEVLLRQEAERRGLRDQPAEFCQPHLFSLSELDTAYRSVVNATSRARSKNETQFLRLRQMAMQRAKKKKTMKTSRALLALTSSSNRAVVTSLVDKERFTELSPGLTDFLPQFEVQSVEAAASPSPAHTVDVEMPSEDEQLAEVEVEMQVEQQCMEAVQDKKFVDRGPSSYFLAAREEMEAERCAEEVFHVRGAAHDHWTGKHVEGFESSHGIGIRAKGKLVCKHPNIVRTQIRARRVGQDAEYFDYILDVSCDDDSHDWRDLSEEWYGIINHAPADLANVAFRGQNLVQLREIKPLEELLVSYTWDYWFQQCYGADHTLFDLINWTPRRRVVWDRYVIEGDQVVLSKAPPLIGPSPLAKYAEVVLRSMPDRRSKMGLALQLIYRGLWLEAFQHVHDTTRDWDLSARGKITEALTAKALELWPDIQLKKAVTDQLLPLRCFPAELPHLCVEVTRLLWPSSVNPANLKHVVWTPFGMSATLQLGGREITLQNPYDDHVIQLGRSIAASQRVVAQVVRHEWEWAWWLSLSSRQGWCMSKPDYRALADECTATKHNLKQTTERRARTTSS